MDHFLLISAICVSINLFPSHYQQQKCHNCDKHHHYEDFFLYTFERSLLFSCLLFMALFVTFMSQDLETNIAIIWSQLGNIKETKDAQKRCGNLPFQNLHIT